MLIAQILLDRNNLLSSSFSKNNMDKIPNARIIPLKKWKKKIQLKLI